MQKTGLKNSAILRVITIILFVLSYAVFVMAINNKMGTYHPYSDSPGNYNPHGYYSGYPTETPFKVIIGSIILLLLFWLLYSLTSIKKALLLTPLSAAGLLILAYLLSFFTWFEF